MIPDDVRRKVMEAWDCMGTADDNFRAALAILTADLPIPDVPEVRAKVEGV